jgi:hypothetical protein
MENLTAHLLLLSNEVDMDFHLPRWKMEDLLIAFTTRYSIITDIKHM